MLTVKWCRRGGEVDSNTLRILVATDCHLGYMERDEIRRFDSFQAFEEICALADQNKVCKSHISIDITCFPQLWWAHLLFNLWECIAGRSYSSWRWSIPWEQAVALNPGKNNWDSTALLPKWSTNKVPGCQWSDSQLPKQVSYFGDQSTLKATTP